MQNERRLMKRAMTIAAVAFAISLFAFPNFAADPKEGEVKPSGVAPSPPQPFNPTALFRESEETLKPPTPEKYREWAGALFEKGDAGTAKQVLELGKTKADPLLLAKDLVRRGRYDIAAIVLEPLLRRSDDAETALLQIACRLMLGEADLARRPLILLESPRDPKSKALQPVSEFAKRLVQMASAQRAINLEDNPWGVKFLPDKSGTPSRTLPPEEIAKLPANAEEMLARWLQLAPMQPTVWALLGQILFVRGDGQDAAECFKRARAMGYNSPIVAEYLRILEREESARRSAVAKSLGEGATSAAAPDTVPIAMTGSSSRAMAAFGFGGLVVGFLIGVMASRRKAPVTPRTASGS
jgi:Flp pilus assembly protein TadD